MKKQSKEMDDEIPLTVTKSSIIQQTKARFDSLLAATTHQDNTNKIYKNKKRSSQKGHSLVSKITEQEETLRPSSRNILRKPLSSSTQKLVDSMELLSSSESENTSVKESEDDLNSKNFAFTSSGDEHAFDQSPSKFSPAFPNEVDSKLSKRKSGHETAKQVPTDSSVEMEKDILTSGSPSTTKPAQTKSEDESVKRPVPFPRKRKSLAHQKDIPLSWETNSSRVSSNDSVMTAIQAVSPCSSPQEEFSPHYTPRDHQDHAIELKQMSPSYEEIYEHYSESDVVIKPDKNPHAVSSHLDGSYEKVSDDVVCVRSKIETDTEESSPFRQPVPSKRRTKSTTRKISDRNKIQSQLSKSVDSLRQSIDTTSEESFQVPKRKWRSKNRKSATSSSTHEQEQQYQEELKYENVIGIVIHHSDPLKVDTLIYHPMVRVHFINTLTGGYLKKSNSHRCVSFYYENEDVDYIQPLTTRSCQFKDLRSLTPIWEEMLLFNEDIEYVTNSKVLILFEIVDFVSFDVASNRYDKLGSEAGWHRIAWAFLKPLGTNNVRNIDKRLRLQLYKPNSRKMPPRQSDCDRCDVYQWWCKGSWVQYPSSLHVTVQCVLPPKKIPSAFRSQLALQPECAEKSEAEDSDVHSGSVIHDTELQLILPEDSVTWSRLPAQSCKIPNKRLLNLPSGLRGCFSLKFSCKGHYLASSVIIQNVHSIYVYNIPSGVRELHLVGHLKLIYSLDWASNDDLLLSASADCTACIWNIQAKQNVPFQMLPHPTFVYCASFVPVFEWPNSLVTGCCDGILRIWTRAEPKSLFHLVQELSGHDGYVSALCFGSDAILFSGDSIGQIRVWNRPENKTNTWEFSRVINLREMQGIVINHVVLHPSGKRILISSRDNILRMLDVNSGVPIQWFKGALNYRVHNGVCISPCGSLVFSASEDSTFCVWNADTGMQLAVITGLFYSTPHIKMGSATLTGVVDYHPLDHIAAFSLYGNCAPVVVCGFSRETNAKDIGLQLLHSPPEDPISNPKLGVAARTAMIASKLKSRIRRDGDVDDFGVLLSSNTTSNPTKDVRRKKKITFQLSDILEQLDQVLQINLHSTQSPLSYSKNLKLPKIPSQKDRKSSLRAREIRHNNDGNLSDEIPKAHILENEKSSFSLGGVDIESLGKIDGRNFTKENSKVVLNSERDSIYQDKGLNFDPSGNKNKLLQVNSRRTESDSKIIIPDSLVNLSKTTVVQVEHHSVTVTSFDSESDTHVIEIEP